MTENFLTELKKIYNSQITHETLVNAFIDRKFPITVSGIRKLPLAVVIDDLLRYSKGTLLAVLPTEREAELFFSDISLVSEKAVLLPAWNTLPYKGDSPGTRNFSDRMKAIASILTDPKRVVVTSVDAFLTPMVPADFIRKHICRLRKGDSINVEKLEHNMQECGYIRVPKVTVAGDFALRGEVFDFFPFGSDEAIRVVLDFDEIEKITGLDPITQKSSGKFTDILIPPCREIIWKKENIDKAESMDFFTKEALSGLKTHGEAPGEEYIFPLTFEKPDNILGYLPDFSTLLMIDSELLPGRGRTMEEEYKSLYRQFGRKTFENPPEIRKILIDFDSLEKKSERKIYFPVLANSREGGRDIIRYSYEQGRSFFGNFAFLKDELRLLASNGYRIYIFSNSETQASRIRKILEDLDLEVINGYISGGFVLPDSHIMAIQENEIFGRKKRVPASVKRAKSRPIDSFVELNKGDFVVHVNYGIGRFIGIDRISNSTTERDYIKIEYAEEETLYIPIEQVNLVQRYIGSEGASPRLDRIGGKSWEARKNKAKKAAEDLAKRLIKLYSRRKNATGYSFPADSDMQIQFEAAFPYDETEDQLRCIDEVKSDMESSFPMDRLVCGDVGYGKTEIAMRAVFKAVDGGKQVAFLCPTTILAEQHYNNFKERFGNFPVTVRLLSRFVPRQEQKAVIEELKTGRADIIIGTHRILQKDVAFRNLGLMVIDEEQRFGVKDKEKMKELKTSVDCLTLSATPIPRTLHMSLLKIRDLSVLETPPRNRRPIETFVEPYSEDVVRKAITREIERGGQVFYLHNRVETLDEVRLYLESLIPELTMETAHGKMSGQELEDVMDRFINKGIHVLISTTIIENGIDIPNVNTIIIDRADMYGISQLYQLRGRVGRSDRLAYAYLLYPDHLAISEIAMKRLRIISDNTGLGAGFKVAMKDLEVRGAGNLLGRDQSGEISSVGFDMYLRLIDEAVGELEHKKDEIRTGDVYLELEYSGYIPDSYIRDQSEKLEIYKKIAGVTSDGELGIICTEMEDRFGPIPDEVESLVSLAEIRILCTKLQISSLREKRGEIVITFARMSMISIDKVVRLVTEGGGKIKLAPDRPNNLMMKTDLIDLKEKSAFIRDNLTRLL